MNRRDIISFTGGRGGVLALALVVVAFVLCFRGIVYFSSASQGVQVFQPAEWEYFRESHEEILLETLRAYNKSDYGGFVGNFSSSRRAISSRVFEILWGDDYKRRFGEFVSLEFLPELSNPVKNYPLLTYRAVFTRNNKVGIRCVFDADEDGVYRIFYLRFDPYEDLYY